MKSSQIAWTIGVVLAYLCRRIDIDPCAMIIMFPTDSSGREFNGEKFVPIVRATPTLKGKIDVSTSRRSGNRAHFKRIRGGFIKFVGSNSPRSVKSSSAPVVIIEEPDDASRDVKGQGDSIQLLEDRAKTHDGVKIIYGGTPTLAGISAVEHAYKNSDQRKLFVPCHHCGQEQILEWGQVHWDRDPSRRHEFYGDALPDTAAYACVHCGGLWSDVEKNRNVANAVWRATAPFDGTAGFGHINELYTSWGNSTMPSLVRRYLKARHLEAQGDTSLIIAFTNSTLGLPYEFGREAMSWEAIEAKAEDYQELVVQEGGWIITAGIDVQHDRFAIILRAWGFGDESWLLWWGEIYGRVIDRADGAWSELEGRLFSPLQHIRDGVLLHLSALTIDCSDGATSEVVYDWVRAMRRRHPGIHIMPGKGSSAGVAEREIFNLPRRIDHLSKTKASRYGLEVYSIGTSRAKDLILGASDKAGRVRLSGPGPGRFHVYKSVRPDYYQQLTSEVKAPSLSSRGRLQWQLKAGQRNEALDAEVYALHAAHAVKTHLMTAAQWDNLRQRLTQADLFTQGEVARSTQPEKDETQSHPMTKRSTTRTIVPLPPPGATTPTDPWLT